MQILPFLGIVIGSGYGQPVSWTYSDAWTGTAVTTTYTSSDCTGSVLVASPLSHAGVASDGCFCFKGGSGAGAWTAKQCYVCGPEGGQYTQQLNCNTDCSTCTGSVDIIVAHTPIAESPACVSYTMNGYSRSWVFDVTATTSGTWPGLCPRPPSVCSVPPAPPPAPACSSACQTEYRNCLAYGPGPARCASELELGYGPLATAGCTAGCSIPISPPSPPSGACSAACATEYANCLLYGPGPTACAHELAIGTGPLASVCTAGCTIPPSPSPPASPSQSYTIIYDNYLCGAQPNECYIGTTGHSTCDYATCTAMCDAAGPVNCVALAMNYPFDNLCRLCTQSELNARTSNSQWQIWQNSVP